MVLARHRHLDDAVAELLDDRVEQPRQLTAADLDFNNKVTREEWLAAANRRFGRLDPAGTGAIKLADLPKTPIQIARDRL